uniref:Uncharacterized protein n=1 Tax=Glossina austeni TaxID=7395 RepID=A0A1A9UU87_GLOAU
MLAYKDICLRVVEKAFADTAHIVYILPGIYNFERVREKYRHNICNYEKFRCTFIIIIVLSKHDSSDLPFTLCPIADIVDNLNKKFRLEIILLANQSGAFSLYIILSLAVALNF